MTSFESPWRRAAVSLSPVNVAQKPLPGGPSGPATSGQTLAGLAARPVFLCALLALATLLTYARVAECGFVNYDDDLYFARNGWVLGGLSWEGVQWAFSTGALANWHPLTWLSLMLDRTLFGPGPRGPHLVNLLLHAANAVLLFLVLRRATGAHWRSALVAGLFALHPLRVESVAWIAERKDVLSGLFGLLSLWFYVRYAQARAGTGKEAEAPGSAPPRAALSPWPFPGYRAALVCFALGLLSKPMLVTWPLLLLLLDWWPLARVAAGRQPGASGWLPVFAPLVREKAPFFALSFLFGAVTLAMQTQGGATGGLAAFPLAARVGNALVSCARYLGKTIWPFDLAVIYPHPGHWPWLAVAGAGALVLGLSALALWQAARRGWLFTGWFWFLGTLAPVIGLVQVGLQAMADRYTYLPLIGLFIAVAWGGCELLGRVVADRAARGLAGGLAGALLLACAVRTADQVRHWESGLTLARHALAVTERNFIAHEILGAALLEAGQPTAAIEQLQSAVRIRPDYVPAWNQLGLALARAGALGEAEASLRHALELNPANAEVLNNLGSVLTDQKRDDEAEAAFRLAVRHNPAAAEALNNLGRLAAARGQDAEAIGYYRRALRRQPALADAAFNLGNALVRQRRYPEAEQSYRQTLRFRPDDAEAHRNLGWVLRQLGRREEALAELAEALRLQPGDAAAREQLRALGAGP